MVQIKIKNLEFTYALSKTPVLKGINLEIQEGEFVVLCGKSGCGKTTLMRMLKPAIAPAGKNKGHININGVKIENMPVRQQAEDIGFVMQIPEHQIVTDKVWHELAFGLENLGYSTSDIRLRVGEMSEYFGISHWYNKNVDELSGGQKQLLNLAAVMAMHPKIIILDEPTSSLDPIAAENFINTLKKINEDLGITIIISEHRLNQLLPLADKVIMLEEGKILAEGTPEEVVRSTFEKEEFKFMPVPVQIYTESDKTRTDHIPLTVGEGRRWVKSYSKHLKLKGQIKSEKVSTDIKLEKSIDIKNVWFRYQKNSKDIVNDLNLCVNKGEIFCILGGNGAGKSTTLSVICGINKPYRGKVKIFGNIMSVPQDVQCIFTTDKVKYELKSNSEKETNYIMNKMGIAKYAEVHPYDLSGGEQQKLGIAKILLANPDIIVLDEPTKGLDNIYKEELGEILSQLKEQGKSILIVSHDVEFCAQYGDRCGLFFNGNLTAVNSAKDFFATNQFYTTIAHKMMEQQCKDIITKEDAVCFLAADSTMA